MSDVILFKFEGHDFRAIKRDGEPWFVAADVAAALEIGRTDDAVGRLDDDEKGADIVRTPGGDQRMTVINESGLYSLIMTSRKPAAKRFKKWVTAEVLPEIRKTGGYMLAAPDETPEELFVRALKVAQATVERQKKQIAVLTPKAEALKQIADAAGFFTLRDAAKVLGQRPGDFVKALIKDRWLFRQNGGGRLVAYQDKINAGMLDHKMHLQDVDGEPKARQQPMLTARGITALAERIGAGQQLGLDLH